MPTTRLNRSDILFDGGKNMLATNEREFICTRFQHNKFSVYKYRAGLRSNHSLSSHRLNNLRAPQFKFIKILFWKHIDRRKPLKHRSVLGILKNFSTPNFQISEEKKEEQYLFGGKKKKLLLKSKAQLQFVGIRLKTRSSFTVG